jgi:hypothetical protein
MNKKIILKPLKRQLTRIRKLQRANIEVLRAYSRRTTTVLMLEKEKSRLWHEENELMAAIHELEIFIEDRKEIGQKVALIAQLSNFK